MDHRKTIPAKKQQALAPQYKSPQTLFTLIDRNESIFLKMKKDLEDQLKAYQRAFSREHNQYIELRDFDHFTTECDKFKDKGKGFVEKLLEIKNNCTTVIKNLPEQERLMPASPINTFDMFVDKQIENTLEHKIRNIEYESEAQRPFENQLYEFQID